MRATKLVLFCFLFAGIPGISGAVHEHEWEPLIPGPFNTWTAPLCGDKSLVVQPLFFYSIFTGSFDEKREFLGSEYGTYRSQLNSQLFIQYGLFEHVEIDIQLSFINNLLRSSDKSINVSGFGDMLLMGRYCPFEETAYLPHAAALFQVKLPTGKYRGGDEDKSGLDLFGTGSTDLTFGTNLSKQLRPFMLHVDLIYTFPGNAVNFNFAAEAVLPYGFSLMIEFNGLAQSDPAVESGLLSMGAGYSTEKAQFLLGYQKTVYGRNTDHVDTIAFTFIYSI